MSTNEQTWEQRFNNSANNYNNSYFSKQSPLDLTKDIREEHLIYLGGFVEGEGSININIRTSPTTRFGMFVDPEFGLYQSNRNVQHLFTLCRYLKAGTVYLGTLKKPGLDETQHLNFEKASYRVGSRKDLVKKVIPFIKKYVIPHAGPYYKNRFDRWSKALDLFDKQVHLSAVGMYTEMIPLATSLRAITPRTDVNLKLNTVEGLRDFLIAKLKEKLVKDAVNFDGLTDLAVCIKFDGLYPNKKGVVINF
jgi:LAGLIDADG endonuclease